MTHTLIVAAIAALSLCPADSRPSAPADAQQIVAALDTEFQAAVKRNDAATMDRILHPGYILVAGDGRTESREALLALARARSVIYEQQDEEAGTQTVRVWGDTAVVTAKLWIKGTKDGKAINVKLWFSDTYVKTAAGWRYAFGQASLPLPPS